VVSIFYLTSGSSLTDKLAVGLVKKVALGNVRHHCPVVGIYQGNAKVDIFPKASIEFFTLVQRLLYCVQVGNSIAYLTNPRNNTNALYDCI